MANGKLQSPFPRLARATSRLAGRPATFAAVTLLVIAWALAGPYFHYSEGWQLTINTLTTIITFLMVFLIQATQNREAEAIQLKLDEIIVALEGARNELIDSEELEEAEQLALHRRYLAIASLARSGIKAESQRAQREQRNAEEGHAGWSGKEGSRADTTGERSRKGKGRS